MAYMDKNGVVHQTPLQTDRLNGLRVHFKGETEAGTVYNCYYDPIGKVALVNINMDSGGARVGFDKDIELVATLPEDGLSSLIGKRVGYERISGSSDG